MSEAPTTIFESFNARSLRPAQVAKTFVPSEPYDRLIKRRHTVVIGPRGSGKTTLLKMLQQPALEAWLHTKADHYRSRIDFTSVFIATDLSWDRQISALGEGGLDATTHSLLGAAAFTTHVLRALTTAMMHRAGFGLESTSKPFRRVVLAPRTEATLVHNISDSWQVRPLIPSLLALKQALSARLLEVRNIASREKLLGENLRVQRLSEIGFLHLHFLQGVAFAVEQFNDCADPSDAKWALLFDELELAPKWIRDELINSLRATDERLIFKLALSPFSQDLGFIGTPESAMNGQDYDQIPLWYTHKVDAYSFCENLWYAMLDERGLARVTPREALGSSRFETLPEEWVGKSNAYGTKSKAVARFRSLSKVDNSFVAFLKEHRIDLNRIEETSDIDRAAILRKISPLVTLREYYRGPKGIEGDFRARSRKSASLYVGAESLFAVTEGNPRWFIAMVDNLLAGAAGAWPRIKPGAQASEISRASDRFGALLRTIPGQVTVNSKIPRGLLSLLDQIGDWLHFRAVRAKFAAEPPGTFTVDSIISEDIHKSLVQALNAGAIVYVPDDEQQSQLLLRSLRGKRFRLAYLLSPRYGLPLRLGNSISLNTILHSSVQSRLPFKE